MDHRLHQTSSTLSSRVHPRSNTTHFEFGDVTPSAAPSFPSPKNPLNNRLALPTTPPILSGPRDRTCLISIYVAEDDGVFVLTHSPFRPSLGVHGPQIKTSKRSFFFPPSLNKKNVRIAIGADWNWIHISGRVGFGISAPKSDRCDCCKHGKESPLSLIYTLGLKLKNSRKMRTYF
ncbi:hypothetical protein CEXT_747821 [Caerostris extrusa]|uniref:Uncharacterized protein n=1 Tax=Caerostris extrusa TaxID=172846 RepID=A0AAV4T6X7_CAEEX|nr:hypothetical protein CEXT_747821 [Caerostris extrusa]